MGVRGVLLFETLQPGETINCKTLDSLGIRRKRPGQLTNGVILQHDSIREIWLGDFATPTTQSRPSDYHLFGPLKREPDEELTMCDWLKTLTEVSSERVSIPWCRVGRSVLTDLAVT